MKCFSNIFAAFFAFWDDSYSLDFSSFHDMIVSRKFLLSVILFSLKYCYSYKSFVEFLTTFILYFNTCLLAYVDSNLYFKCSCFCLLNFKLFCEYYCKGISYICMYCRWFWAHFWNIPFHRVNHLTFCACAHIQKGIYVTLCLCFEGVPRGMISVEKISKFPCSTSF